MRASNPDLAKLLAGKKFEHPTHRIETFAQTERKTKHKQEPGEKRPDASALPASVMFGRLIISDSFFITQRPVSQDFSLPLPLF